mmetsp:Transcript_15409/g.19071  ORF Transcript_15409/g.19071 Transcript_15409/m.19071 type:complete len:297 (-) Transcript_15409:853-1743(-)|eukprot:CAMPEP_0204832852 /NCGR_PEP_ID=MMETSP1346-20131115/14956_1 /ASSEMBLY_ACC=CAM_ASM_000771 /TAXON_ID=215587 /ORGANISM="Aplanochytrium stocchinoi, Strain GSBS06" /LENGTH=296 /DNA_ID=CAMNT_0051964947 /DNA_START=102 /DNA_END=992 /DNA_ORIENTATION=-
MEPSITLLHVHGSSPDLEQTKKLAAVHTDLKESDAYKQNKQEAELYFTDAVLHRFCCARNYDHAKSLKLLIRHTQWRFQDYRPFEIAAKEMEEFAKRGSIQVSPRGNDGFDRPLIILDDSKDNTNIKDAKAKQRAAMKHLTFNMERATRQLKNGVNRWVVFISLEDFSLWTSPSVSTTRETIDILTCQYPERLGVCVLYKAPWIFSKLWNAVLPFIDKVSRKKVVFISGDTSEGSKNDQTLKEILGEDWRVKCGQDEPAYEANGSRGYKHSVYWNQVVEDEKAYLQEVTAESSVPK